MKAGNSLISIHCENERDVQHASEICERGGATDVTTSDEVAVGSSDQN